MLTQEHQILRIRALRMLEMKVMGKSKQNIAKEFGVSPITVTRALDMLQRAGLLVKAEDTILEELVPLATEQVRKAISLGDTEAAMKILEHVVFKRPGKEKPSTADGESLDAIISEIRSSGAPLSLPSSPERTLQLAEGELVASGPEVSEEP